MPKWPDTATHVAVLMGGTSNEREVSLRSGRAVADALAGLHYRVTPIDMKHRQIGPVAAAQPDLAFIAMHGEFGEDGQIQQLLEDAGIPYTGSGVEASRIGMNKAASKRCYRAAGISTPEDAVFDAGVAADSVVRAAGHLGFPLVCKPVTGGSSICVSVVRNRRELTQCVREWKERTAAAPTPGRGRVGSDAWSLMLEKYIPGREVTVGVLDGRTLPVIEIVTPGGLFDYTAKYEDERTQYHVPVSMIESVYRKVSHTALRACAATGCRHMARVDMICGYDGGVYVLEVNTIPGLTSRSLLPMAARYGGVGFPQLCHRICRMALEEEHPAATRTMGNVS